MSGGGGAEGAAGYRYYFGIFAGLCRGPVDQLREVRVGGKMVWQGDVQNSQTVYIDAPNVFGGEGKEGGIQGPLQVLMGEPDQMSSGALAAMLAPSPPTGFRRMVTTFFDGLIAAVNPYPKPWSYRLRRARAGWDGAVFEPSLARIVLQGEVGEAAGNPWGPQMRGEAVYDVPRKHFAVATLSVPGRVITNITSVEVYSGGIVYPGDEIFYGADYMPDGTARLKVSPLLEQRIFNGAELFPGATLNVRYDYTVDGVPGFEIIPKQILVSERAPRAFVNVASAFGGSVVSVEGITIPDPNNVDGVIGFDGTTELLPNGTANYYINPWLLNKAVTVRFRYNPVGGGGPYFQDRVVTVDQTTAPPTLIQVEAPNGGKLIAVDWVADTRPILGSDQETTVPRYVPFTVVTPPGLISIQDYQVEGHQVRVAMQYQANFNAAALLRPDSEIWAMNPAHILYECYTNREWGRGLPRSSLDYASFLAAAQTLVAEGFGMCLKWSRRDGIDTFIQTVLDHIAASVFTDRATALLRIKLIRGDYNRNELKVWDTSNGILQIKDSKVNTSAGVINEIIVKYRDPVMNRDRGVNVQNLASLQSGAFNTQTKTYMGIPTAALARRVAQRDLRAYAEGLRRFELVMDRRGSELIPGGVMRIQDAARNVPDMVVRIATIKDGTLQNGEITLSVVQDVFSLPAKSFTAPQPSTWTPPNFTPCIGRHDVFEVPYYLVRRRMRPADFALLESDAGFIGTVAERASPYNSGYALAVRDSAPTFDDVPSAEDQLYCGYTP